MKNMFTGKFATILFIASCFISVHSLSLKNKNPIGLKGEALKNFTITLYEKKAKYENIPFAKKEFDSLAGPKQYLTKDDVKTMMDQKAIVAGAKAAPQFVIDRFYNLANTKNNGKITFEQFQPSMVSILTIDIKDFGGDLLKEDPTWKYVPTYNRN